MTIDELHDRLYELLKTVDGLCRKHQIRYMMHGGSAIGAVREHDFIPWDDDMDLLILAEDYPRFLAAMRELPEHVQLLRPQDFSPYFYDFILRVCDDRWRLREETAEDAAYQNYQNRVGIDIFILSGCPKAGLRQKLWLLKYDILYGMAMQYRYRLDDRKYSPLQKCELLVLNLLGRIYSGKTPARIIEAWERFLLSSDAKETKTRMVSNTTPQCYWHPMPDAWFADTAYTPFRDLSVPLPGDYDSVLRFTYGDYMTPVQDPTRYIVHLDREVTE